MGLVIFAFFASALSVCGSLPQIIKIIRTKDTAALSYGTYFLMLVSSTLWTIYGFIAPFYAIIIWNSLSVILAITVLVMKYRNERRAILSSEPPTNEVAF